MVKEFKIIESIYNKKKNKDVALSKEFEDAVNHHLKQGWRLLNCSFTDSHGQFTRTHYTAFLLKDI